MGGVFTFVQPMSALFPELFNFILQPYSYYFPIFHCIIFVYDKEILCVRKEIFESC